MSKWFIVAIMVCFSLASPVLASDEELGQIAGISRTCAGCHGTDGASPGAMIPIIGGQVEGYLVLTMEEFAADQRPGSAMLKFAKGYSAEQRRGISAYFAAKPWVNSPWATPSSVQRPDLVRACTGCHGSSGEGRSSTPRLAGQAPEYLHHALLEYQRGERPAATMRLMRAYDEATIKLMADHFSSLK
jgi:cytochrome subunit of sulfide dehydrogenase